MTAVLASTSVHISAGMLPQVGSVVLAALPLRYTMRAMEAAMTKAPRAKVDIKPRRTLRAAAMLLMTGIGRMKT